MIKSRVRDSTKESKIKFKPFKSADFLKKTHSEDKLTTQANTFSNKGFGNGFVSKADRFSGVDESRFQIVQNSYAQYKGNPQLLNA